MEKELKDIIEKGKEGKILEELFELSCLQDKEKEYFEFIDEFLDDYISFREKKIKTHRAKFLALYKKIIKYKKEVSFFNMIKESHNGNYY